MLPAGVAITPRAQALPSMYSTQVARRESIRVVIPTAGLRIGRLGRASVPEEQDLDPAATRGLLDDRPDRPWREQRTGEQPDRGDESNGVWSAHGLIRVS